MFVCVYIHTMEYYSAIKKNVILPFAMWPDLENTMLSEISWTEKIQIPYDIIYMWNLKDNTNVYAKQTQTYRI